MDGETLEQKVERLALEVEDLRGKVESLTAASAIRRAPPPSSSTVEVDAGEEIVQWMGKSSFLPRVSTVCFLLVAALVLRTVTDNGLLDKQAGSLLGMAYATLLICLGAYKYGRSSPLAPVFAVCGALLMYTIVVETHAHFESLPSVPAYIILILTGIGMASISYFHQNALPVLVGSLGMGIAAIGIDYPTPYYPHLAVALLVANLLGAFATRLRRCSWLRWILLLVTGTTLLVWGVKLTIRIGKADGEAIALGLHWYLPVIALFALVFFGTALFAIFRAEDGRVARFDLALPSVNAFWLLAAALTMARAGWGEMLTVGMVGILAAALHGGAAWLLVRFRGERATGVTALILAAAVWFSLSAPMATGNLLGALPLLSLAALAILFLSRAWSRGSLRGISYILQASAGIALAAVVLDSPPGEALPLQALAGASLGGLALAHYLWCRGHAPPADSRLFGRWDKDDRTAVFLLMAALAGQFFLLRSGIWLLAARGGDPAFVFQAGQSILVNLAAAGLVLLAYPRRNKELRNVGILLILVGGGRVFLGDLPRIAGVPLVGSVLSFGIGVSLVSVALTRWQRPAGGGGKEEGGEASGCGKYA